MSTHLLENAYWISQVVLALVAICAALAAFAQIGTFKLFELLKYLEASDLRKSRRIVIREIDKRRNDVWWNDPKDGDRLEIAASDVCASYDILGRMIEFDRLEGVLPGGGYGLFFRQYWGRSIIQTHETLRSFLKHRRESYPDAYMAFSRLAEAARPYGEPLPGKPLNSN